MSENLNGQPSIPTSDTGVNPTEHTGNVGNFPVQENVPTQPAFQPQAQPAPAGQPELGFDTNDENFVAFNQQLQQFIGVDAITLRNYVNHIAEQQRENALQPLRSEWGDAYDSNFDLVRQRWVSLPAHEQAKYDSVDGAKYLLWQIQQEQAAQQAQVLAQPQVPQFDRGRTSVPQAASRYQYKLSEVQSLPKAEYAKQAANIAAAFAQGLVDLNS